MTKNSRTSNSIRNFTTGVFSQIVMILLRFVCRTVFIATLGKEYLGINGLFSDILTMLSLSELGLDTAINFKLYKPLSENDVPRLRVLMKFYKNAYHVIGIVILLLGVLLIPFLPILIKDYDSVSALGINPVLVFCLFLSHSASSYLFFAYKGAILKADQQEYIISLVNLISQLVLITFQIVSLIVFKDFILYTILSIVVSVLANLTSTIITKKKYKNVFIKTGDKMSKEEKKDLFKDLGATFVYKANGIVLKATDNLVLSAFIGIAIVGIYSNYLLIYTTIKTLLAKFFSAVKASMGNLYAKESIEKRYAFFEVTNYLTFILYGTAAVGIAVCADELLTVWLGTSFIIPAPFSVLIGIEVLFAGIKTSLGQIRNVTGAFRQMWFRPLLGVVINLTVSIVLVQFMGIYGVIIGTIVADITTNFAVDPTVIHKFSFESYKSVGHYYKKQFVYMAVLTLVGVVDYLICRVMLTGLGWFSVILHAVICGISVPLVFCLLFKNSHEFNYLFSLGKNLIKKR